MTRGPFEESTGLGEATREEARSRDGRMPLTSLFMDALDSIQRLVQQEFKLAKDEILEDVDRVKQAAISAGIGIGLLTVGGLFLAIGLVHLLRALTDLPLWSCYGIVGGLLVAGGFLAVMAGKRRVQNVDFVPNRTIQTMKENAQWMVEQTRSGKM
jgi:hypothetical protein